MNTFTFLLDVSIINSFSTYRHITIYGPVMTWRELEKECVRKFGHFPYWKIWKQRCIAVTHFNATASANKKYKWRLKLICGNINYSGLLLEKLLSVIFVIPFVETNWKNFNFFLWNTSKGISCRLVEPFYQPELPKKNDHLYCISLKQLKSVVRAKNDGNVWRSAQKVVIWKYSVFIVVWTPITLL